MSFKQDISLGSTPGQSVTNVDDVANNTKEVRIFFTGDVMLGRSVMSRSKQLGDHLYPFRKTVDRLRRADLTIINLENPIIENCPIHTEGFRFCSEPGSVSALEFAGINIASIANNHALDWGREGREQTIKYLNASGIESIGYDNVVYKKMSDVTFAFVGFDFVSNAYLLNSDQTDMIIEAKNNSDVLIASIHWGNEYFNTANSHQRRMARELIGLGVDMIIGHHPHWIQDVECFLRSDGKVEIIESITSEQFRQGQGCPQATIPVYYSLGNFVFDQMWSGETRTGAAVETMFIDGKFVKDDVHIVYMQNWAQPEWIDNAFELQN